jgi:hypothetical protein
MEKRMKIEKEEDGEKSLRDEDEKRVDPLFNWWISR